MSQCKAIDCEIYSSSDVKDFNSCKALQSLSQPICSVGSTNTTEINAKCEKRSDVSTQILIRTSEECNLTDVSTISNPQFACEEITGCEWGYTDGSVTPITKICKPKTPTEYTCENEFSKNNSRYGYIDSNTFGCDKINCEYTPVKKRIQNGECIVNTDPSITRSGNITCSNLSKSQCLSNDKNKECIWIPNDEEYCGYNRTIEYYLEKINLEDTSNPKYNINEITTDNTVNDPCKRIQNPSRENCESNGCIWNVYGDRYVDNHYNMIPDPDNVGSQIIDKFYYDISSTGLCEAPVTEKCMDYFCSRDTSRASPNYELSDGVCESNSTDNNNTCIPSNNHIISDKTPGMIEFLPNGNNYPDHIGIPRTNWGSKNDNSDNLNKLLGFEYNLSKENGKDVVLNKFAKHYKDNCEKNLIYPSSDIPSSSNSYDITKNKKKYDESSDLCYNETINNNKLTNTQANNTLCNNYHHKNKGGAYTFQNNCSNFVEESNYYVDANNTYTNKIRVPAANDGSSAIADSVIGYDNSLKVDNISSYTWQTTPPTTFTISAGPRPSITDLMKADIMNNNLCNKEFYKMLDHVKNILRDISSSFNASTYTAVGVPGTGVITAITYTPSTSTAPDSTNFATMPGETAELYPITIDGAITFINKLIYTVNNNTDDNTTYQNSLKGLLGIGSIDEAANVFTMLTDPPSNTGKITLDMPADAGAGVSEFTGNIEKIAIRILQISSGLITNVISYDEYLNELSRFFVSMIIYTGGENSKYIVGDGNNIVMATDDSKLECVYDPYNNSYSFKDSYTADTSSNNYNTILEHMKDILPVKLTTNTTSMGELLGGSSSDTELTPNITNNHSIKDIVHRKGSAILTFQLYQKGSDNILREVEINGNHKRDFDSFTKVNFFSETAAESEVLDVTILKIKVSDSAISPEDQLFDQSVTYSKIGGAQYYVGGIIEIEVDQIEPGLIEEGENIYKLNNIENYSSIFDLVDSDVKLYLKEIRFKDNPIDIYFYGDIDGLYRKNDIISINGLEANTFNQRFAITEGGTDKYYQKIDEVDNVNNKITIKNGTRKGKYFIGRELLETNHYNETTMCYDQSTNSTTAISDNYYCDATDEIYDHCSGFNDVEDGCVNSCVFADGVCKPNIIQFHLGTDVPIIKCKGKDVSNNSFSKLHYTKCANDLSDGLVRKYNLQVIKNDDNKLISYNISDFYEINASDYSLSKENGFLNNWRIEYFTTGLKKIGKIENYEYETDKFKFKIRLEPSGDTEGILETADPIDIISLRPPRPKEPTNNLIFNIPTNITIETFVKKDVTFEAEPQVSTNSKLMCDFNNGFWNNRSCISDSTDNFKNIRGVDICENTGYKYDNSKNLCYKEIDVGSNRIGSCGRGNSLTYGDYCRN